MHFTVNVKEGGGEAGGTTDVTGEGGVDVNMSCYVTLKSVGE